MFTVRIPSIYAENIIVMWSFATCINLPLDKCSKNLKKKKYNEDILYRHQNFLKPFKCF